MLQYLPCPYKHKILILRVLFSELRKPQNCQKPKGRYQFISFGQTAAESYLILSERVCRREPRVVPAPPASQTFSLPDIQDTESAVLGLHQLQRKALWKLEHVILNSHLFSVGHHSIQMSLQMFEHWALRVKDFSCTATFFFQKLLSRRWLSSSSSPMMTKSLRRMSQILRLIETPEETFAGCKEVWHCWTTSTLFVCFDHTSYLSLFLHNHNLRPENFTLESA